MKHIFPPPTSAAPQKGQLNILAIVLVLALLVGIAVFLLSTARSIGQDEYLSLYTSQLLLSTLREDASTDPACATNAELLSCAFLTPSHACGGRGPTCDSLARDRIPAALAAYEPLRPFRWHLSVQPEGFVATADGEPVRWELGDPTLATAREKFAANTRIQRVTASGPAILRVQLLLAVK